jgi:hypothetical protein
MCQRKPSSVVLACIQIGLHTKVVFRRNNNRLHVELGSLIGSITPHTT